MEKLRSLLLLTAAIVVLTALSFSAHSSTAPPVVKLSVGSLAGVSRPDSSDEIVFLGVPYAAPPVSDLRWKPPEPAKKWNGVRKSNAFGPVCPQQPQGWLPYIPGQEDCLYLNIWTPHLSAGAKLPVIVFFHGGSNTAGYSQFTPLGPAFARLGVVVVTTNYRLGPFGFFAHPALTAESPHHSSGNYGLLDQIQALHWVHDNIVHFGGDPARVTIMGQSAGAVDVCMLMASPLAKDLFRSAILQSGECQSGLNEDIRQPIHYNGVDDTAEAVGERLASDLGVSNGPDAAQKLRNMTADAILKAWSHDPRVHFEAIVDGWVVPEQPVKIFAERKQSPVPILIGGNADEATVFGDGGVKTVEEYKKYLQGDTGKFADQEFAAYPASLDGEVAARYLQLQNDSFAYAAYSMALNVTRSSQPAYLYKFTFAETGKRASLGAHHGLELNFLADSYPPDWEHNGTDKKLGEYIRGYWTQFAKTDDPNYRGAPAWPVFNAQDDQLIELGRNVRVGTVSTRVHTLADIMTKVLQDWGD
jgi:para-nitrobenzyl esterase